MKYWTFESSPLFVYRIVMKQWTREVIPSGNNLCVAKVMTKRGDWKLLKSSNYNNILMLTRSKLQIGRLRSKRGKTWSEFLESGILWIQYWGSDKHSSSNLRFLIELYQFSTNTFSTFFFSIQACCLFEIIWFSGPTGPQEQFINNLSNDKVIDYRVYHRCYYLGVNQVFFFFLTLMGYDNDCYGDKRILWLFYNKVDKYYLDYYWWGLLS